mmetsp:Transcript_35473/g.57223  ORF Transcript_35473/g.57223 Transcript_35473/m.57223 type:complete len:260 (-) Transcript_35473:25-804(-)
MSGSRRGFRISCGRIFWIFYFKAEMRRSVAKNRQEMAIVVNNRLSIVEERIVDMKNMLLQQNKTIEKQDREISLLMERLERTDMAFGKQIRFINDNLAEMNNKLDNQKMPTTSRNAGMQGLGQWSEIMKNHFFLGIVTITMIFFGLYSFIEATLMGQNKAKPRTLSSRTSTKSSSSAYASRASIFRGGTHAHKKKNSLVELNQSGLTVSKQDCESPSSIRTALAREDRQKGRQGNITQRITSQSGIGLHHDGKYHWKHH